MILPGVPDSLLVLVPLAIAAGLDTYLAILFLGLAPMLGWEARAPGALGQVGVLPVLVMAGLFYVLELWLDRSPLASLFWNAIQALVRPLAAGLLAALLFAPQPYTVRVVAVGVAIVVAILVHGVRSGWWLVLDLGGAGVRQRVLLSAAEDVAVLGLLSLALEHPPEAAVLGLFLLGVGGWGAAPYLSAFPFGLRLAGARSWGTLSVRRWWSPERFPRWVRRATVSDEEQLPGGGLRGAPVGAVGLPGSAFFTSGWLVVRGGHPVLYHTDHGIVRATSLHAIPVRSVHRRITHEQVVLGPDEGPLVALCFPKDGPSPEALAAEFDVRLADREV